MALQIRSTFKFLVHLLIWDFLRYESIIIRDTNLVSLKITEAHCLVLQNAPKLVDVQISWLSCQLIRDVTSWLSCCFSTLEFLTLFASQFEVAKERGELYELPQFTNLRQFVLIAGASKDDSMIGFTSLISASPNLEKFVLKLEWWNDDMVRGDRELKKGVSFPLQHLKVVELRGYYGRRSELELVEYFLENATALEKLIIDPPDQANITWRRTRKEKQKEKSARIYAKQQLEGLMIPSRIEFVIQ